MLTDEPARVAPRAARLCTEARRIGRVVLRQLLRIEDLIAMVVCRRHLRRRHEVVVEPLEFEHILGKFWQLPCADHACLVHDIGGKHLRVAVFFGVEIHHEVNAGALKPCAKPLVERKACARDLRRALCIEDAECVADVPVRLRGEIKRARRAAAAHLRVLRLVLADRHIRLRHIRNLKQEAAQAQLHVAQILIECRDLVAERAHLRDDLIRVLARLLARADLLRDGVAARLLLLHILQDPAAALLELCERREVERIAAMLQHLLHGGQVLTHKLHIQH